MVDSNSVPLMFRAQIETRSQIQRLIPSQRDQQAYIWAEEWMEAIGAQNPEFSDQVQVKSYAITWRFITNSGQDEGVIRPVIGARGYPYYPGASMKGAFLRACTSQEGLKYCGGTVGTETKPGLLRFHGGYPKNADWKDEDQLVDVVHPQENWQVKNSGNHSAFIQISLYKPELIFGISCQKPLEDQEWETIWQIWEKALGRGIGSRVSAGYGQPKIHPENSLLTVNLKGQGLASQLINKEGEFRANMFKAALRGHTLRLLGGVTNESTAEELTKHLWGGFAGANGSIVGKLGIAFQAQDLELDDFTYTPSKNPFSMPIYDLKKGQLDILLMGNLSEPEQVPYRNLVTRLIKFSLLLGGFGKSWRRIDHRMFFEEYLEKGNKPMIGCHWEFISSSQKFYCPVQELGDITKFLNDIHSKTKNWVSQTQGKQLSPQGANWREAWHPQNVQVWGRIAENKLDSIAIEWFHGNYNGSKTIKQSDLTGKMGRIGRIWHRMCPRYIVEDKKIKRVPNEYIELLTIFPDSSQQTQDFLMFLAQSGEFEKLWGGG
ncbi:conserved hypothetical protein [Planktothrix sp. PCC 11201]|uniref:hypothetical protein n=1 Tax=Planktothrix sp. PCC 11201 TaxID=1729650 RepID=UPI000911B8E3|nr:hypothetical protein [Planktothrix sp. PCC 11201]SKB15331.1 conserved hypothetical protein [Planktothrix sp. PCC 11201]